MKSLGGGNKAIDTIKSPHKRETFYEIRNIAHKKENKENIKERLFSQPRYYCVLLFSSFLCSFGSTADSHYLLKIRTDFLRNRILPHKIPSVSVHLVQSGPPSPVSADG